MGGDASKVLTSAAAMDTNLIQSLEPDGFTIGTAQEVNTDGTTYHWVAMRAGSNLVVGSYVGNGVDNRSILGVGFQPSWVVTLGDGSDSVQRPGPIVGDGSYLMSGTVKLTNRIQAMEGDGFQIGSNDDVNELGTTFHYVAWKGSAQVSTGTYTGNGVDSRSIWGTGFEPLVAWIKRDDSQPSVWRPASLAGDWSLYWGNSARNSNRIQSLQAFAFQVGTNAEVNSNGSLYYYISLRDSQ